MHLENIQRAFKLARLRLAFTALQSRDTLFHFGDEYKQIILPGIEIFLSTTADATGPQPRHLPPKASDVSKRP
jgi:hypothetical protein